MRRLFDRIPMRFINYVYWFLLVYLIAALAWWYIELDQQNDLMMAFQKEELIKLNNFNSAAIAAIEDAHARNAKQYIGEGLTFLIITIIGAVFVYSVVRRQIRFHLQQKNFMMAVTHELKTPIAVTKLSLETLKRHKLDEDRQRKILGDAINETDRLNTLCNNILLSSQLESGGYTLTKQEFNLSNLVEKAVADFRRRYPTRKIDNYSNEVILLQGEEFLIGLVLNNLLENAVKYTSPEEPIMIGLTENENTCILSVADLGRGIPDAEKSKIFEKFYRLEDESKRKTKGTGLGLYLSSKIVEDHHGRLTIENNHPTGSVFKVILPKN